MKKGEWIIMPTIKIKKLMFDTDGTFQANFLCTLNIDLKTRFWLLIASAFTLTLYLGYFSKNINHKK